MSNAYHSGGKWTVGKKVATAVYAGNDSPVCICDSMGETLSGTDAENARRIVACVNAFEGMPVELIDSMPGPVSEMARHTLDLLTHCERLLAALEAAESTLDDVRGDINPERGYVDELEDEVAATLNIVQAAIAAAKEGA